jgi:hypothetical protein
MVIKGEKFGLTEFMISDVNNKKCLREGNSIDDLCARNLISMSLREKNGLQS